MFKNKTILITGGTGSFGNALLKELLRKDIKEIRIFSRDEKKQDDMRKLYGEDVLKFYIGDIRDYDSLITAVRGSDYIFHAAALKQVPSCEFHPLEAVKTNVLGTENVLEASINSEVKKVVCLSTDKAVYPINAMGISKAMMEKVMISKARSTKNTIICATRYGNVMASRGSVIPLFCNQIITGKPITITNPFMTRFMMNLNNAIDLVFFAFNNASSGDIFVQKAPAASIETLSNSLLEVFNKEKYKKNIIGTRHGEKLHEVLLSKEEIFAAEDLGEYYKIPPDLRDMDYGKYFEKGEIELTDKNEYSSSNTKQLNTSQLKEMLCELDYIKDFLKGKFPIQNI